MTTRFAPPVLDILISRQIETTVITPGIPAPSLLTLRFGWLTQNSLSDGEFEITVRNSGDTADRPLAHTVYDLARLRTASVVAFNGPDLDGNTYPTVQQGFLQRANIPGLSEIRGTLSDGRTFTLPVTTQNSPAEASWNVTGADVVLTGDEAGLIPNAPITFEFLGSGETPPTTTTTTTRKIWATRRDLSVRDLSLVANSLLTVNDSRYLIRAHGLARRRNDGQLHGRRGTQPHGPGSEPISGPTAWGLPRRTGPPARGISRRLPRLSGKENGVMAIRDDNPRCFNCKRKLAEFISRPWRVRSKTLRGNQRGKIAPARGGYTTRPTHESRRT